MPSTPTWSPETFVDALGLELLPLIDSNVCFHRYWLSCARCKAEMQAHMWQMAETVCHKLAKKTRKTISLRYWIYKNIILINISEGLALILPPPSKPKVQAEGDRIRAILCVVSYCAFFWLCYINRKYCNPPWLQFIILQYNQSALRVDMYSQARTKNKHAGKWSFLRV